MVGDCDLTVSGVGVADHGFSGGVYKGNDITLDVGDVVVGVITQLHGQRQAVCIVGEVSGLVVLGHLQQLGAAVDVAVGRAVFHVPSGSEAGVIVGVVPGGGAVGELFQLSAVFPLKAAVADLCRVADVVMFLGFPVFIGDRLPIISGQQVAPLGVAVGIACGFCSGCICEVTCCVSIGLGRQDVTGVVVGPGVGLAGFFVILPDQLVGGVVGVGTVPVLYCRR